MQLFRERLSEKVHATLPIAIVSDFEFTFLPKKFERIARNMDICLRVLKEATKVGSTAAIVGNSVLVLSYITIRDCRE